MVKLIGMLSRFHPVNVLVVGDFMLDTYTTGKVKRISPEAPVPVLLVEKEESLAGGAGNVALNLASLGAQVRVIGRVGFDHAGDELRNSLKKEGIDVSGLLYQKEFKTPVKNRLIAHAQQVIRVDFEAVATMPEVVEHKVLEFLKQAIQTVDIVAVSDYGKGLLTQAVLSEIMTLAGQRKIPVIVDPKGDDFSKYLGATIIKPNLSEAVHAAKLAPSASLHAVAATLLAKTQASMLLITRSEAGMSLFTKDAAVCDFPVRSREVKDVTGAGDTVLAMLSIALANGLDITYAVQLSNIAAGIAIERLGCARITLSELSERLLEIDIDNKIFEEQHLFALEQALKGKKFVVLGVQSRFGMTTELFKSIRRLASSDKDRKLIIYIMDTIFDEEFVLLLSSLAEVDFIVLQTESLKNLCQKIHPEQVYIIEGSDNLVMLDHATALLARVKEVAQATQHSCARDGSSMFLS